MHRTPRVLLSLLVVIGCAAPLHALGPASSGVRQSAYLAIAGIAVTIGWLGVRHHRPTRRLGWLLLLAGCAGCTFGDLVWAAEQRFLSTSSFAVSDAIYLVSYLALGAGALSFTLARSNGRDLAALLDAAIITAGAAILVGVFLLPPLTATAGLSAEEKALAMAYPLADLFLLGVMARVYSARGARTPAYRLLAGALLLALTADTMHQVALLSPGKQDVSGWVDTLWLLGYLLIAAAACVPSMTRLDDPAPECSEATPTRSRLVALTASLMLPGVALLVDGFVGSGVSWLTVGVGMLVLSALVLLRLDGLLTLVTVQSDRLAAIARSDALTGAPNRRTWDQELPRACRQSVERRTPLAVAMIDLDQFKVYNDTHGHQAGDQLLRDAVLAWTEALPAEALLARYGGEEFALLVPGADVVELVQMLNQLREVTPAGQTFSAGIARWEPGTVPATAVACADEALYAAKRAGRDRVVVQGQARSTIVAARSLPLFTMVTQPIVDLTTSSVSAHEALTRFTGLESRVEVPEVFRRARAAGHGDLLELAAVRAALALPGRPSDHDLFVNVSAQAVTSQRFLNGLPARLDGVVIELSEDPDGVSPAAIVASVGRLRASGARLALDDVGAGSQEFARLVTLRPDVIKMDRTLVAGCVADQTRTAVLLGLVGYARHLGVTLCAEGVEDVDDLLHLAGLGVTHAQGDLLARPGRNWEPPIPLLIGPHRYAQR